MRKIKSSKLEVITVLTEEYEDDPTFKGRIVTSYPDGSEETQLILTERTKEALSIPKDAWEKAMGTYKPPSLWDMILKFLRKLC